jgi:hypothetical protein
VRNRKFYPALLFSLRTAPFQETRQTILASLPSIRRISSSRSTMSGLFRSQGRSPANLGRVANRSRGRRRGLGSSTSRGSGQAMSLAVPPFNATFTAGKRLRFEASGAGTVPVTVQDLFDLFCMATSAIAAYRLFSGVRVRKVQAWGPMPASLVPTTVALEWANATNVAMSIGGPNRIVSDTSMGATRAAFVSGRPPAGSLASFWLSGVTPSSGVSPTVFTLNLPSNTIVDLTLDFVLQNDLDGASQQPQAVSAAVAGASTGEIYLRKLDSNGAGLLVPVSYVTI